MFSEGFSYKEEKSDLNKHGSIRLTHTDCKIKAFISARKLHTFI